MFLDRANMWRTEMGSVAAEEVKETKVAEKDVDPHFKNMFKQIAGNDEEVSVFKLVEILNKVFAKRADIKSDGFSLETGRHIISLLDKNGNSKLGLVEFHVLWMKIQKYMEIFKRYDSDRSGTMSSHEMRDALTEAGFQINNAVLQVIVNRYASAHYAIDFHCFVDCLIRLEMLFKMFKTLDTKASGKIELDVSQWLCLAIN